VFILAAVLLFGTVAAYASGVFSGGQFVKSVAEPQAVLSATATEDQDKVLYGASTEVAETVTRGNVAVTLDEVTVDEFAVYTKLTIRSVDGKPLYAGDPDGILVVSTFEFDDGEGSTTYTPGWERLDDGSDAAYIEIAQRTDFTENLKSFKKALAVFSALGADTDSGSKTSSSDIAPISDGRFEFAFPINPIVARSFTTKIGDATVDVKLTPLSISYRYKYNSDLDLILAPVDKSGAAFSLGSGGVYGPDADGYMTGTFGLAEEGDQDHSVMIDVGSIVGVHDTQAANGEVYTLTER
jgi:hypothetical protein